jgi:hypothetical protein
MKMEWKVGYHYHVHIDIAQAMTEPKRFMPMFKRGDGKKLTLKDFLDFMTDELRKGYDKYPINCDNRGTDGSCVGHKETDEK